MDILSCATFAVVASQTVSTYRVSSILELCVMFLASYVGVKSYRIFLYHKLFSPLRHIPGPKGDHFFFGQFLNTFKFDSPNAPFVAWMKEHPEAPFIRYRTVANNEILFANSLNAYREVLQTHCYSFEHPTPWKRMVEPFAGKGIIMLEGEEHRAHRKMLNAAFTPANLRRLGSVFREKAREVGDRLDDVIPRRDARQIGTIDASETFSSVMMDIMGITSFGVDPSHIKSVDEGGKENTFLDCFDRILSPPTKLGRALMFAHGYVSTRWFPCEANRDFNSACEWMREELGKMVADRRRAISSGMTSGEYDRKNSRDLLSFMLEESLSGGSAEGMTDQYIVGHLLVLLSGGHDTSSNLLCWSLFVLATKPDIQDKVREEMTIFEACNSNPDCFDLDSLPYLNSFVREVLRVYPPAVFAPRQAATDITIEGVFIPKGTQVDILPAPICVNPLIWGDDADEVDPTRWDHLTKEQASPYAWEVFSNGPRICIGKQFSMHESKAVLYELVRRFRFVGIDGEFRVENPGLTLRPSGMRVQFERI